MKVFKFKDGKIIAHFNEEELAYLELTGDFISSVRIGLYPESLQALKEVFRELNI